MPENVNRRIEQQRRSRHRDPQQWILEVYLRGREIDHVRRQSFRKPACANQTSARRVNNQSGQRADEQRLPRVALQGNVNNNYEGESR